MRPKEPELDRFGFPVPCSFDEVGPAAENAPKSSVGRRIRLVLRMAIVAAAAVTVWNHFDLGTQLREGFALYLGEQAERLYRNNDLPGALAAADRAVGWSPENVQLLLLRSQLRLADKDYRGCLADAEQVAALEPTNPFAHEIRRSMYFYLHEHRKASEAATEDIAKGRGDRAILLNSRAYSRALGDFELEAALADIDEAISLSPQDNSSYIDTRAYVLFRLKRYPEALKDLNRAISLTEKALREVEDRMIGNLPRRNRGNPATQVKQVKENLAVMYHHRGEVYEAQGKSAEAKKDFEVADLFGFNPEEGVY